MPCNKALLLFSILLLVSSQSAGIIQAFNHGKDPMDPLELDSAKKMKSKKHLEEIVQLDYDYAGPNPKHNPRRGGGSRNP